MKYFNIILLIFLSIFYFYTTTAAQQRNSYVQIDTVKISELPKSMSFIFKVDTSEIILNYDNYIITTIKIFNMSNGLLVQTIIDTSEMQFDGGGVQYVDVNLDGYKDLDIDLGSFNLIPFHSFWLYNQLQNKYHHSKDYSMLNDYYIYEDKKEIESVEQFLGGRGGIISTYQIENGDLIIYKNEFIDTDDSTTNVQIDLYKKVFDSLMVIEKRWLVEVEEAPIELKNSNIYEFEKDRTLKYLKKELYFYHKINSQIVKDVQKYQVVKNKWQLTKE